MSKCLCEAGGSGSGELKKCPPPFPAILWFVNGWERKPRQKKTKTFLYTKTKFSVESEQLYSLILRLLMKEKGKCLTIVYRKATFSSVILLNKRQGTLFTV